MAFSMAGCSLPHRTVSALEEPEELPVTCASSYDYLESFASMSDAELLAEIDAIDRALDQTDSYCANLRLAIFLSTPFSIIQSDSKSIRLYKNLLSSDQLSDTDRVFITTQLQHISQRESLR